MNKKVKKFGIAYNSQITNSFEFSEKISAFFTKHGEKVTTIGTIHDKNLQACIEKDLIDILIVLGGDGTMLRACHLCSKNQVPIVGINLGTMGFLIEVQEDEWHLYLKRLLEEDYRIERRMMLQAEHVRSDKILGSWQVVNEVVTCRGQYVRPIRLSTEVDGYSMANYVADGIIAATPTGSTAYALAAGGAILPPDMRNIIIVPIAPHLSPDQAIVLPEGARVSITVHSAHQAVFSIDGHSPVLMQDGDQVHVSASDYDTLFVRFHDPGFFYRSLNRYLEQNPSL